MKQLSGKMGFQPQYYKLVEEDEEVDDDGYIRML